MAPPVRFPPMLVATVNVPATGTVILSKTAVPVPPPAAFTLICTAPAVVFVVVIELPAFIVKLWAPAPSVLALIATVPEPASTAPERDTVLGELIEILPVVVVKFRTVVMLPGLKGAVDEVSIVREILPVPAV